LSFLTHAKRRNLVIVLEFAPYSGDFIRTMPNR